MRFDIITIFPHIFDSYLNESILKRARERGLVKIKIHNLRDFAKDKHKKVDDRPFGGGPGMVLKVEPLVKAIQFATKNQKTKSAIILFSLFFSKSKREEVIIGIKKRMNIAIGSTRFNIGLSI